MERLRFKDENGNAFPEWIKSEFGKVAVIKTGKHKKSSNYGKYIIMDMGSVSKDGNIIPNKKTDSAVDLLFKGDLIMPKDDIGGGNIIGRTAYIPDNDTYVLGDHVFKIELNKNNSALFFHYLINNPNFNHSIRKKVTGSAQLGLNAKNLSKESITIPQSIKEQEKIGGFFNAFDRLIVKQREKVELLRNIKKGFSKKIFSIDNIKSNDWKKYKLSDISIVNDGTHHTPQYKNEGIPFYSVETIANDTKPKYISLEEHNKLVKRCRPEFGDILLTRIGTMGKTKIIDWKSEFSIYVSLALIKPKVDLSVEFLNQFLMSEMYKKELLSKSLLLATPVKINVKDLKDTIIYLPSSKEQLKISKLLIALDRYISCEEKRENQMYAVKKSYLQKLFV